MHIYMSLSNPISLLDDSDSCGSENCTKNFFFDLKISDNFWFKFFTGFAVSSSRPIFKIIFVASSLNCLAAWKKTFFDDGLETFFEQNYSETFLDDWKMFCKI